MTRIEQLRTVAQPPAKPVGPVVRSDWLALEAEWKFQFPTDYKEVIETYGAGHFADFFGVQHPFVGGKRYTPHKTWVPMCLQGIEDAKVSYPESAVPLATYPQAGGLFPWGYTDNGDTLLWLMEGSDCERWPVIYVDADCSDLYERFNVPLIEFLVGWLGNGATVPKSSPEDFFPLKKPVFVPHRE